MMPSAEADRNDFLALVSARRGHFLLESGYHGALWLELGGLFSDPGRVQPFIERLADAMGRHHVDLVCGPLQGGAELAQHVAGILGADFAFTERAPQSGAGLFTARYRLPSAFVEHVRGKRIALIDDVMSAGSSLRATHTELLDHGAIPVVAGALLVLGTRGQEFFAERGIPVEAVVRDSYDVWAPESCPMCARGEVLEQGIG